MIYLDYAANTPVEKDVLKSFVDSTIKYTANPNSSHPLGKLASDAIDKLYYRSLTDKKIKVKKEKLKLRVLHDGCIRIESRDVCFFNF